MIALVYQVLAVQLLFTYLQLLGPEGEQASITAITGFYAEFSFSLSDLPSPLLYLSSSASQVRALECEGRKGPFLMSTLAGFINRSFPSPMSIHIGRRPTMSLGLTGSPCYVLKAMDWA